jgi:hypothetical protein
MTPSDRASEILSHWPSKNFVDPAARPSIQKQIEKAIEQHMADMGIKILDAVMADSKIGMHTKDLVANHVMEVLGIEEGTTV